MSDPNGPPEDKVGTDLEIAGMVLSPITVIAPFFGPPGVFAAIAVGALGGGSSLLASRRAAKGVRALAEHLHGLVEHRLDEFEERLREVEAAEALAVQALRAAAQSPSPAHARAVAVTLARGVLGPSDPATSEVMLRALEGLTEHETSSLVLLARSKAATQDKNPGWIGLLVHEGGIEHVAAIAVAHLLVGRGLIAIDPPGFTGYFVTPLGDAVAERLQAGE